MDTPARVASSSRRSPGVRRIPGPVGRATSAGRTPARRVRTKPPNSVCSVVTISASRVGATAGTVRGALSHPRTAHPGRSGLPRVPPTRQAEAVRGHFVPVTKRDPMSVDGAGRLAAVTAATEVATETGARAGEGGGRRPAAAGVIVLVASLLG